MELRQLESFVAVAANRSFTRAAAALRFDQSTVSRHVAQLERDLRVVLLRRSAHCVELTACGERFLPQAKEVLECARLARQAARHDDRSETAPADTLMVNVPAQSCGLMARPAVGS